MWTFCLIMAQMFVTSESDKRSQEEVGCNRYLDVAIVGAGPAGTYSAYRLRHENLTVEVFEYFNRVGGRLYTTSLADAPDVAIDLGAMVFQPNSHKRIMKVLRETGIAHAPVGKEQLLKCRHFVNGTNVDNLGDLTTLNATLLRLFVEKLTGYYGSNKSLDHLRQLKLTDGRYLYEISLLEAFKLVASKDIEKYVRSILVITDVKPTDSVLIAWQHYETGQLVKDNIVTHTLSNGMNTLPKRLAQIFLNSNKKHRLSLNRQLLSISTRYNGYYKLMFRVTKTTEQTSEETVCAKKVILAVPKLSFSVLDWAPVRHERIMKILLSVREELFLKVFFSFSSKWWLSRLIQYPAECVDSDRPFAFFSSWARSEMFGHYVTLSSFPSGRNAQFLQDLNSNSTETYSATAGDLIASKELVEYLLDELSEAFGAERKLIPSPVNALLHSWIDYPFGGGWSIWKAGFWYKEAVAVLERPSPADDIFYIASDFSLGNVESTFKCVDDVIDTYF